MATYYVRPDGRDANAGTGPDKTKAWQTVTKALGATGISSGDIVYFAPGTYREVVEVQMTTATVETLVIGDVSASQFSDLQAGEVIWTGYVSGDRSDPSTSMTLDLSGRAFLTFVDLIIVGSQVQITRLNGCLNITFRRCSLRPGRRQSSSFITMILTVDVANNILFDSCELIPNASITIQLPTSTSADYDAELVFKNCLIRPIGTAAGITVSSSGANSFKGGGIKFYNCTIYATTFWTSDTNLATSAGNQCEVYNCMCYGVLLHASTSGQIVEDYNYLNATTPRTNVTAGSNSIAHTGTFTYSPLISHGQEHLWGMRPIPHLAPTLWSPLLGFGNHGSIGVQSQDAFGVPRPSGAGRIWSLNLKAVGWSELPNTGERNSTTVRTGVYSLKLRGYSIQDIEIPVDAVFTTVTVYGRYDSAYGLGILPEIYVLTSDEIGVTGVGDTMTVSEDTWEQLSIEFTPAREGVATIRLLSYADGSGSAFFDDFEVTV